MKRLPVALCACLDERRSAHASDFKRAVVLACEWLSAERSLEVLPHWFDDAASEAGGALAARSAVRAGARAVVGHFASVAACAAAPIYEERGIPLFLPAATAARLRSHRGVHRLCDADDDFGRWICDGLVRRRCRHLGVFSDGSVHGESARAAITECWGPTAGLESAESVVFTGTLQASLAFVNSRLEHGDRRPLFVTDDAHSTEFARAVEGDSASVLSLIHI